MLLLLLTEGQREATILILSRKGRADDQEAIENELVRRMVIKNVLLC